MLVGDPLLQQLQLQARHASELFTLLSDERRLLGERDADAVLGIAERKRACLAQLEASAANTERLLRHLSRGRIGLDSIGQYLDTLPAESRDNARSQLAQVKSMLHACQQLNDTNGRIIAISRRNVDRAMNLLKGQDGNAETYTAQGLTTYAKRRAYQSA